MNDDELIERLRRTLQGRAEGLHPTPGRPPVAEAAALAAADERAIWGPHEANGAAAAAGAAGAAAAAGAAGAAGAEGQAEGPRTAEYNLVPPTGPVPIVSAARRRWLPLSAAAVLATAAAVTFAVALSGKGHPVTVQPGGNSTPSTASATLVTPVPSPTTTPGTTPQAGTTTPTTPPAAAVPAGFQPFSITFVSANDGWTLGWAPCTKGQCAVLAHTTDGGHSWFESGAPPISAAGNDNGFLGGPPHFQVRFANRNDGYIWTAPGASQQASTLYQTTDGGATWVEQPSPFPGATIADLEAAGGAIQLVAYGPCPSGSAGCAGQTIEEIFSSRAGTRAWTQATVQPGIGAGPVLDPQLTLWGRSGWLLNDNRTTVSGARFANSGWTDWTPPPCAKSGGDGYLAAASEAQLVAVCAEGTYGNPDPGTTAGQTWLFTSSDGGRSFQTVGPVPGRSPQSVTVAPGSPDTIVVADGDVGLETSFDGGRTWSKAQTG
ncbi:MAG TPA: hypothetical protein VFH70_13585, partial [Acidimicrobiales bacterium]|nr:hypothetical protein [Acidimicrobiales bacterium]